jgi:hypothetical protein
VCARSRLPRASRFCYAAVCFPSATQIYPHSSAHEPHVVAFDLYFKEALT